MKRGQGKSKHKLNDKNKSLIIVGNNVAGLKGKKDSLENLIESLKAGIIMLQETKLYREGKFQLQDFIIFEKHRNHGGGGGLLTASHVNLNPVLYEDEDSDPNFLTVDVGFRNVSIRTINAYGPQENPRKKKDVVIDEDNVNLNKSFFLKLRTEIQTARLSNKLICIQMDANSKVGDDIIKNNPVKNISENGKLLM